MTGTSFMRLGAWVMLVLRVAHWRSLDHEMFVEQLVGEIAVGMPPRSKSARRTAASNLNSAAAAMVRSGVALALRPRRYFVPAIGVVVPAGWPPWGSSWRVFG